MGKEAAETPEDGSGAGAQRHGAVRTVRRFARHDRRLRLGGEAGVVGADARPKPRATEGVTPALCRRYVWLRQMISLASLCAPMSTRPPPPRSPVRGTLVLVCTSLPAPPKTRTLGHLADHRIRGAREHAFPASSSASTDHGMADGDTRASKACQPAWRGLLQGRVTQHRRSRRPDTIARATGSAGWGQDLRAPSCRKGQSPRPCPHALPSSITHSPTRPEPE
jgi:hypothetical protein